MIYSVAEYRSWVFSVQSPTPNPITMLAPTFGRRERDRQTPVNGQGPTREHPGFSPAPHLISRLTPSEVGTEWKILHQTFILECYKQN